MINKRNILIYSFIPVILSIVFISGYFISSNTEQISSPNSYESFKLNRIICVSTTGEFAERETPSHEGTMELVECGHNLVVNMGLNATRDILGQGTSFGAFNVISVGNASNATSAVAPAAGDTIHSGEYTSNGLSRAVGTYATIQGSAGNWSIYKTFTASGISGLTTNKTCLFNQTTVAGSTMLACMNFNQVTLDGTSSDSLLINITSYITSG